MMASVASLEKIVSDGRIWTVCIIFIFPRAVVGLG
jgi:hypothetical protein